ncbi:hypothetical protein ID866_2686 [Astraeus odoratus]|nr:hypothetical protein ID866_2686 [Astraeus odoratus]
MLDFCQTSVDIDGVRTDILVQPFADRTFVQVTQLGKMGNLVHLFTVLLSMPSTVPIVPGPGDALPSPPAAIQLTPLLGSAPSDHLHTLYSLYAAQIATLVWLAEEQALVGSDRRSVIVSIALRKSTNTEEGLDERERSAFHDIMKILMHALR